MRKPLALMLAGLMAASMVGCGSNGDAASSNNKDKADSGKVTLKVTTTYAGEDTNAGNYKDACAAWTKETGNKIEDSSATSDETFKSRVITDFETGSEPDVLFFFNGVDSNQFVEQGKVVSNSSFTIFVLLLSNLERDNKSVTNFDILFASEDITPKNLVSISLSWSVSSKVSA